MEHFYTLQGEGMHSGKAAYFIRLGGCNVGCHWCDVKDSWDVDAHPELEIKKLVDATKESGCKIVVVTGGEPAMHNLESLTSALKKGGLATHIETSGAYPITGKFDWICVSPKKRKPPLKENLKKADELKVVVYNQDDFSWAEKNAKLVSKKCKLLLQPEWGKSYTIVPLVIEYIKKNPKWQISLQTHKFMQIP
jgi:organic radical activating enzyme